MAKASQNVSGNAPLFFQCLPVLQPMYSYQLGKYVKCCTARYKVNFRNPRMKLMSLWFLHSIGQKPFTINWVLNVPLDNFKTCSTMNIRNPRMKLIDVFMVSSQYKIKAVYQQLGSKCASGKFQNMQHGIQQISSFHTTGLFL